MTVENDTLVRKRIHDYWDERLREEAQAMQEAARLRVVKDYENRPWFIRLLDWFSRL
jgi:hypothetical protein